MLGHVELRHAHDDLLACYREVQQEFAEFDDSILASYLGQHDSQQLRQQIKEHGDGYTMRSVPSDFEEMVRADVIVLIVMNSPKLDQDSVFNPNTSLTDIPYWRYGKGLRTEAQSKDGSVHRFLFLVWEQDYAVHGETTKRAHANQHLLLSQRPRLCELIAEQAQKSEQLLSSCKDWLAGQDRRLIVLTNAAKSFFKPPIAALLRDERVWHIPTKLFGPNRVIMSKILERVDMSTGSSHTLMQL